MITLRPLLLTMGFVAGSGILVFENRLLSYQRAESKQLNQQLADTKRQLVALRSQRDGTARDLSLAEQQLSRLATVAFTPRRSASDEHESTTNAWLSRAQRLRLLAAENSALVIPEMQLLADEDWMRVALKAAFDTDAERREALAALRDAAKEKFVRRLASSAQRWTLAEGLDKVPVSAVDLGRYVEPPVDPAILRRYEIVSYFNSSSSPQRWRVREAEAIDEDYDKRYSAEANGSFGSSGGGPLTWNEDYATRVRRAYEAYATANQGTRPQGIFQIVPYITPPLPPATLEKLLQTERHRSR